MTAVATVERADASAPRRWWQRSNNAVPVSRREAPPLSPTLQLVRAILVLVFVLSFTLILQLTFVSRFQHSAAQGRAFDSLRAELARGTAPVGPADESGKELALGTPVAFVEARTIGLSQVVLEGTTPAVMFDGPGHRRDTPLPGQVGTSVVFGRAASFGGPFSDIDELRVDDVITVTTGQGAFNFKVIGLRREGDPAPPPAPAGSSRLLLVTADGVPFLPEGVLRVDAQLDGDAVGGAARLIAPAALPANERIMAGDSSTLWALALWLQALIVLSVGAVWAWHRWGRAQAWIVFLPPMMLVGLAASGEAARLLPNLL
jgi:sortase (surface protein transpeptidase)